MINVTSEIVSFSAFKLTECWLGQEQKKGHSKRHSSNREEKEGQTELLLTSVTVQKKMKVSIYSRRHKMLPPVIICISYSSFSVFSPTNVRKW